MQCLYYITTIYAIIQGEHLKVHATELETSYSQLQGLKVAKACILFVCGGIILGVMFTLLGR